jgi:hypothetical protein
VDHEILQREELKPTLMSMKTQCFNVFCHYNLVCTASSKLDAKSLHSVSTKKYSQKLAIAVKKMVTECSGSYWFIALVNKDH